MSERFVCCKCHLVREEIGGFSGNCKTGQKGFFCKQCGNSMPAGACLLPEYRTFLPNFSKPVSLPQRKEEKRFVEKQLAEFRRENSDAVRQEWNLLVKKLFPNGVDRFEK